MKSAWAYGALPLGLVLGALGQAYLTGTDPQLLRVLTAVASLAIVGTFIVYYFQLRTMRDQLDAVGRGQNFFTLIGFLQDPQIRAARRHVIEVFGEAGRPLISWTSDDREQASIVCSSYDAASIAYTKGFIDREIFKANYGPSLLVCFKILSSFVVERQKMRGASYWDDFEALGKTLLNEERSAPCLPSTDAEHNQA